MAERSMLWLIYRRARVGFAFMGFIIMYAVFAGALDSRFAMISISVFFAELFGACYNDSQDLEEDARNNRKDKLTVSNVLTIPQMKFVSLVMLAGSIVAAAFSDFVIFSAIYLSLAWAYSNPSIRLKKYTLKTYLLMASVWFFIPVYFGAAFRGTVRTIDIILGLFFFFQYSYLLSQKDSTDTKDSMNLFIDSGRNRALIICCVFGILSSAALFALSFNYTVLILPWAMNFLVKSYQSWSVYVRIITRDIRSNCTLMEFLTPYVFAGFVYLFSGYFILQI